jgi:hypothetical protein
LDVSDERMTELLDSCAGDVRHAISSLQFLSVAHTAEQAINPRAFSGKGRAAKGGSKPRVKKKKGEESNGATAAASASDGGAVVPGASSSRRDDAFSIFHSVGKILYAKTSELREVESIIEAADMPPLRFLEWVHSNYVDHLRPPLLPSTKAAHGAAAAEAHRLPTPTTPATPSTPTSWGGAAAITAAKSPPPPAQQTSGWFSSGFDDEFGPDLDADSFDRLISAAGQQASRGGATATAAAATATSSFTSTHTQSNLDEEALQALVDCTRHMSDADVLAEGSKGHFGDVSGKQQSSACVSASSYVCVGSVLIVAVHSLRVIVRCFPAPFRVLLPMMLWRSPPLLRSRVAAT